MKKVSTVLLKIVTISQRQNIFHRFLRRCKSAICFRPLYNESSPNPRRIFDSFRTAYRAYFDPLSLEILSLPYRCKGRQIKRLPRRAGYYDYLVKVYEETPKGLRLWSVQRLKIEGDVAVLSIYLRDPAVFDSILC